MDTLSRVVGAFPLPAAGMAGCVCAAGALLYRAAIRKKPTHVEVNCWFCSQDTTVPYGNRNCWDCPTCEQYNGFQENGDYNKPIPAQYMEHLNHTVSSWEDPTDARKIQQWPNGQLLFCKKCNGNQTLKVKQLASFVPRDEDRYEDEIEMYRHYLEQTYKLCRPCQTTAEYYIKHQDRQIRAILFDHQLRRREADKTFVQSSHYSGLSTPIRVLFLRFLAFASCAVLLAVALHQTEGLFTVTPPSAQPGASPSPSSGPSPAPHQADSVNRTSPGPELPRNLTVWQELLRSVPADTLSTLQTAWSYSHSHQTVIAIVGLTTCLLAIILGGRVRLRRIDAVSSLLWLLVMGLHLTESYLQSQLPAWLGIAKLSATSLCCLVGLAAAAATRKSTGQRRARARRYLSGEPVNAFYSGVPLTPCSPVTAALPLPTPPSIPQLARQQLYRTSRRNSPSSLPGRLNRALSLGTVPSLTRADSGYLFSGSRPPSHSLACKDSPPSDYFSLKSESRPSSPSLSPAPSVAGSFTSSSGSWHHRRPLISPARLNLTGQRLKLFMERGKLQGSPSVCKPQLPPNIPDLLASNKLSQDLPPPSTHSHDVKSVEGGSVRSEVTGKMKDTSSESSACAVDTTTNLAGQQQNSHRARDTGLYRDILCKCLVGLSLAANLLFATAFLCHGLPPSLQGIF